ncbi:alpha/beta-hydrolase [Apiospora marii]|uniref:Alpha/beta-hydrolase n=1 Tax=Apiospora marii TaxID=335849 RepID=A0ABR1R1A8_9PEZI
MATPQVKPTSAYVLPLRPDPGLRHLRPVRGPVSPRRLLPPRLPRLPRRSLRPRRRGARGAMTSGGLGPAWDGLVLGGDFGFKLEDVKIESGKVVMWHGELDQNVPAHMTKKAAALMPGAELRLSPEHAHIDLPYTKADEVMRSLRQMLTQ